MFVRPGNAIRFYLLSLLLLLLFVACQAGDAGPPTPTLEPIADQGQRLFKRYCTSCHSTKPGMIVTGPSLSGVGDRAATRIEGLAAQDYIRQSILSPDAYVVEDFPNLMPKTFANQLDGEQVDQIIAYLLTLE